MENLFIFIHEKCITGYSLAIIPSNRARLQTAIFFVVNHLYINDDDNASNVAYNHICDQSAIKLLRSTTKTLGILVSSIILAATLPIIITISRHEIQLVIPVLVPFTDLQSWQGLCINALNQLITTFVGACATIGIEIIICIWKNSLWTLSAAVCYSLDELMRSFNESDASTNRIVKYHFRNVVLQMRDRDRYAILVFSDAWKLENKQTYLYFSFIQISE